MSDGSTPASAIAARPDSTARSRNDFSCWILCGVLPIPRTPTRITPPLVRFGLAAAGPTVVRAEVDRLAGDLVGGPRGGRRLGDLDLLRDRLAAAVAEGDQVVARLGAVQAHGEGDADRRGPQVADLPHEARALELALADAGLAERAQGLRMRLARADRGVVAGSPLGDPLEAREGVAGRRRVGVEEHLEPVARLGLGAQAPDVVDLAPSACAGAQAGDAARGADQEGGRRAGREGVADALVVADQVVRGHHQRGRAALGGQRPRDPQPVSYTHLTLPTIY